MKECVRDRTFAAVYLKRFEHNLSLIKKMIGDKCKLMSVLKSDAYGHGAKHLIPSCEKIVDSYAVATIEEAVELRSNGATKPILVLGYVDAGYLEEAALKNITLSILSLAYVQNIQKYLSEKKLKIDVHIKIDTGLNRTGITVLDNNLNIALREVLEIYSMSSINVCGIFSHLSCPNSYDEDDKAFTEKQFSNFLIICNTLKERGCDIGLTHICSSTSVLSHKEKHLDMVRIGMLQYGQTPYESELKKYNLLPILNWKAKIIMTKSVDINESIGYSRMVKTTKPMDIAIVSVGFGDGYRRNLSNKSFVLLHGIKVPVLGKVAMDFLTIDITGLNNVNIGDTVTLLGWEDNEYISTNFLSELTDGVLGEVTCGISKRVPRVYID